MTTKKATLIPVGIDCGSLNARIAIQTSSETIPSIVPNEIGQRHTITLAAPEPDIEDDPLNDQYWDNSNHSSAKGINTKSDQTQVKYLVGDSARKSLNRLKKPLDPHYILNMMQELETMEQNEDNATNSGNRCKFYLLSSFGESDITRSTHPFTESSFCIVCSLHV
jgi:hypothetical protein